MFSSRGRIRRAGRDLAQHRVDVRPLEGPAPGERDIETDAQRVDVGARVELDPTGDLLGADVIRRADQLMRRGQLGRTLDTNETEVHQEEITLGD